MPIPVEPRVTSNSSHTSQMKFEALASRRGAGDFAAMPARPEVERRCEELRQHAHGAVSLSGLTGVSASLAGRWWRKVRLPLIIFFSDRGFAVRSLGSQKWASPQRA